MTTTTTIYFQTFPFLSFEVQIATFLVLTVVSCFFPRALWILDTMPKKDFVTNLSHNPANRSNKAVPYLSSNHHHHHPNRPIIIIICIRPSSFNRIFNGIIAKNINDNIPNSLIKKKTYFFVNGNLCQRFTELASLLKL